MTENHDRKPCSILLLVPLCYIATSILVFFGTILSMSPFSSSVYFKISTIINSIATDTQASTLAYAPSTSSSLDQAAPASARSSVDGWGELEDGNIQEENSIDKGGWDDVDPFDDKPSLSLLSNIQAAQKRPVVQPKQAGKFAFVKYIGFFFMQCMVKCKDNQMQNYHPMSQ